MATHTGTALPAGGPIRLATSSPRRSFVNCARRINVVGVCGSILRAGPSRCATGWTPSELSCGYACADASTSTSARLTRTLPPITSVRSMSKLLRCSRTN
jgi:hypothetical protein